MFFAIMVDALSGFRNRYYLNGRQWKRGEKNNRNVCSAANGLMVYRYAQYSLSPHTPPPMYEWKFTSWFFCLSTSYPCCPGSASTIISFSFQKKEIYEIFFAFFFFFTFTRRNAKKTLKRFFYNAQSASNHETLLSLSSTMMMMITIWLFTRHELSYKRDVCRAHVH